jgi:glycine cleavage system transcriptional repressor
VPHVAISAIGLDQPGIVAAVTGVLMDQGCNLEDTSMTILRGQFAMMLVVDAPEGTGPVSIESALAAVGERFDLVVRARTVDESAIEPLEGAGWTVVVYGADRPGIVNRVASLLAGYGANVVDLTTRVMTETEPPSYAMVLEVVVPPEADTDEMTVALQAVATELDVECTAHPSDADIL